MQHIDIIQYIKGNSGYARTKDLKSKGISTRTIKVLLEDNTLQRIKRGLYKLTDYPWQEHSEFVDICHAKSQAVIALASALEYYGLTTFMPSEITIALPHNFTYNSFKESYPPVQVFYFRERYYDSGIETVQLKNGMIKIYNIEKTVCDMFRYRKQFGEDIALEGLKGYLALKKANIPLLVQYSVSCNVKTIMTPYMKALVS